MWAETVASAADLAGVADQVDDASPLGAVDGVVTFADGPAPAIGVAAVEAGRVTVDAPEPLAAIDALNTTNALALTPATTRRARRAGRRRGLPVTERPVLGTVMLVEASRRGTASRGCSPLPQWAREL